MLLFNNKSVSIFFFSSALSPKLHEIRVSRPVVLVVPELVVKTK